MSDRSSVTKQSLRSKRVIKGRAFRKAGKPSKTAKASASKGGGVGTRLRGKQPLPNSAVQAALHHQSTADQIPTPQLHRLGEHKRDKKEKKEKKEKKPQRKTKNVAKEALGANTATQVKLATGIPVPSSSESDSEQAPMVPARSTDKEYARKRASFYRSLKSAKLTGFVTRSTS